MKEIKPVRRMTEAELENVNGGSSKLTAKVGGLVCNKHAPSLSRLEEGKKNK